MGKKIKDLVIVAIAGDTKIPVSNGATTVKAIQDAPAMAVQVLRSQLPAIVGDAMAGRWGLRVETMRYGRTYFAQINVAQWNALVRADGSHFTVNVPFDIYGSEFFRIDNCKVYHNGRCFHVSDAQILLGHNADRYIDSQSDRNASVKFSKPFPNGIEYMPITIEITLQLTREIQVPYLIPVATGSAGSGSASGSGSGSMGIGMENLLPRERLTNRFIVAAGETIDYASQAWAGQNVELILSEVTANGEKGAWSGIQKTFPCNDGFYSIAFVDLLVSRNGTLIAMKNQSQRAYMYELTLL